MESLPLVGLIVAVVAGVCGALSPPAMRWSLIVAALFAAVLWIAGLSVAGV